MEKRPSEEQIINAIKQHETGIKAEEICSQFAISNGTFYNRPEYYTVGVSKYFDRNYGMKIQGSFTYVDADGGINDFSGNPIGGDEWIARIITSLAF